MMKEINAHIINLLFINPDMNFLKGSKKLKSVSSSSIKDGLKNIFDAYYEALVLYANRFLPSIDECEGLVQDLFVDLWEKDPFFPDEISLKIFLYKSTRNKCFNVMKHSKVNDNMRHHNQ